MRQRLLCHGFVFATDESIDENMPLYFNGKHSCVADAELRISATTFHKMPFA